MHNKWIPKAECFEIGGVRLRTKKLAAEQSQKNTKMRLTEKFPFFIELIDGSNAEQSQEDMLLLSISRNI